MTSPRVVRASAKSTRWSTPCLAAVIVLLGGLGCLAGRAFSRALARPDSPLPVARPTGTPPTTPATGQSFATVLRTAPALGPDPASAESWQEAWERLRAGDSSPSRDRQLAGLIENLARTDPQKALALAAQEGNWRLRDELRDAALRGWASVDPQAAGNSALLIRVEDRRRAVAAVLDGAASRPDLAVPLALRLCAADPDLAGDHGHSAVAALANAGDFEAAVRFATEVGAEEFPFLLKSAFYQWSRHQPGPALAAAEAIADPVLRHQAMGQAFFGWSQADAQGLAAHALKLPVGDLRAQALAEALPRWIERDPVAATEWMQSHDSGADFDPGAGALAQHPTLLAGQPAKAMEWAGTLSDPRQRADTLRAVFRQWAAKDDSAARRYAEQLPDPRDRALLDDELRDSLPR